MIRSEAFLLTFDVGELIFAVARADSMGCVPVAVFCKARATSVTAKRPDRIAGRMTKKKDKQDE